MRFHTYIIHDRRCKRCGRCLDVCPTGAIRIPQGVMVTTSYGNVGIDQDKCIGCGACADSCKIRAISKKAALRF